jgi:deazaflavin-dependent oxidoreductase (nitroreductase family)
MSSVEDRHADEPYAYVTTTGRRSGRPHEIEIWFAAVGDTIYLMNGGGTQRPPGSSDWVRNLRAAPEARVRIAGNTFAARARFVEIDSAEHEQARELLVAKYQDGYSTDLGNWRRTAFPVALELQPLE